MKSLYSIVTAAILFGTAVSPAGAEVRVSVDFFHDSLESYGDWREVGDYGYCWQPRDVDADWRPYSDGRWLYTDAGWTWDSEEPYSWAVYHYGRWARIDEVGWIWVPGTEWGPAWVSWRRSSRHVGWAPLPPEAEFTHSVGFGGRVDADYDIGPTYYNFVEVRNFGAPRLRTVILRPRENITIIRQTTNITRITYVNNVVHNEGPQYSVISRESARPIRRLRLERREELDFDPHTAHVEQLKTRVEGDSLRVVALPFETKPASAPRKVAAKVEKPVVDRGWKDAGPPAEVTQLRARIKDEPATAAELPPKPTKEATAEAPDVSPVPPPPPGKRPAKGKGGRPTRPDEPVTAETAPTSPEKPVAPDRTEKPGKPGKGAKSAKPEAGRLQPAAPAPVEPVPSHQLKEGGKKKGGIERLPVEARPQAEVPGRKPMSEKAEHTRKLPPTAVEPARPKPEQPAVRKIERNVPNNPEPRPQARKPEPRPQATRPEPRPQVAPAATQSQPPQPAKGKGKGKGKGERKDGVNPEGAPQ